MNNPERPGADLLFQRNTLGKTVSLLQGGNGAIPLAFDRLHLLFTDGNWKRLRRSLCFFSHHFFPYVPDMTVKKNLPARISSAPISSR
jgi:hypothetical protein